MPNTISRIRRHWAKRDYQHRKIALGFLWVSFFVMIGKLAGAAKEMAIAWRYGVSETVDAYVFAINLINLPVSIWFSVLCVVLIPILASLRQQSPQVLLRFRAELFGLTLLIGITLGGASYFLLPLLLNTGWLGLSGNSLNEAMAMVGPFSVLLPMGVLISLFSVWLMANGHHSNTLLEALPALVILIALLLPPTWFPEPLIWGTVAGIALQMSVLGVPLQRTGELTKPAFHFQSPAWKGFWRSFGIMAAGQVLMSLTSVIDQLFAAHLEAGSIATLGYANRIVALIAGLGAMAISRSTLPVFSELASREGGREICSLAIHWAKLMFLFGLVATALCWWSALPVVKLLFQRGAFTVEDSIAVAGVLRYLALQLPFYFSGIVLVSLLSTQGNYMKIQIAAFFALAVKVVALIFLVPLLGMDSIAFSTAMMFAASTTTLLFLSKLN
jgi:peptidoglycan biosynthesis protein MviN/MurJ (putative lipid II flippase)